ncbi:MAG: prepilin-type N-terminal cleavage/methylation domain-containing protein [Planctomycetota bacterium]
MRLTRKRRHGFTLIELAVTVTVVAVIAAMGAGLLVEVGRAYAISKTASGSYADAQHALERVRLELAALAAPTDISSMSANSITFTVWGSSTTYSLSGGTLQRDGQALAADCSKFELTYYQSDGSIAAAPATVHRIAIEIAVTRRGRVAQLRTEVFPRSFRGTYVTWAEN